MKSFSTYLRDARPQRLAFWFFMFLGLFSAQQVFAQILINPAAEGGFEQGSTFAANGWTVVNGSATNKWQVGTIPTGSGFSNRSAFISKDNGTSWKYDTAAGSVVHFYRDVTFPAGVPKFELSFDLQVQGEAGNWDEFILSIAPTNFTPTVSTGLAADTQNDLPDPAITLARYSNTSGHQTINLTIENVGNCTVPIHRRLIFTWKNTVTLGKQPPAAIDNIKLEGFPITISHPADQCENESDITYSVNTPPGNGNSGVFSSAPVNLMVNYTEVPILGGSAYNFFGPPFPQFPGQATFRASIAPPDDYIILYTYTTPTCVIEITDEITIKGIPAAALQDRVIDCVAPGELIDVNTMLSEDDETTDGGTWTVSGGALNADNSIEVPNQSTCYTISYSVGNQCGPPASDTKKLMVELKANPEFTINGQPTDFFGCESGAGNISFLINRTSDGDNPRWKVFKGQDQISSNVQGDASIFAVPRPANGQTVCYTICLLEDGDDADCTPGILNTVYPNGYQPCTDSFCLNIIMYNDGYCDNGNASLTAFPSECDPNIQDPPFDACPIYTSPYLQLSCYLIKVKIPYKIVRADLSVDKCAIFCDDSQFTVKYKATNVFNDIPGFNTKLKNLNPALGALCNVVNFCICVPGVVSWRPLRSLGKWCDESLASLTSRALQELAKSKGSGGLVVADTDGDGTFDFVVADYKRVPWPLSGNAPAVGTVANQISKKGGVITLRHVTGWPYRADKTCGVPTNQSLNLLEVLAPYINLIPIAGPMINGFLQAAHCNIPLAFSDYKDVRVPVINNTDPEFKNCPPTGYVFTEDFSCSTAVNWSIPVAADGCIGDVLTYVGRTSSTDATHFSGQAPTPVVIDHSGVYQTGGPIVGSVLTPGTYQVTYSAFSCRGVQKDCTFPVLVTGGSPQLTCPNSISVPTDVDQCQAVVTGIGAVGGLGCGTVINYSVVYPPGSGFSNVSTSTVYSSQTKGTHNDASGLSFPLGTSTVTYTLSVDLNGDGDALDMNETQTCSFTVTVFDAQKPTAHCSDIEVKLDNTGNATVYAAPQLNNTLPFVDGGSSDNCDPTPLIEIQKAGDPFGPSVSYNCTDVGDNFVNIKITDDAGNFSTCIGHVKVIDYLEGVKIEMDLPELCLEANNPSQLNFANYLTITLPDGQFVRHSDISTNAYLSGSQGYFFITAFLPEGTSTDPGSISYDGVYTPGTGTGFLTISYLLFPPGFVPSPDSQPPYAGCYEIVHHTFELRQPLTMDSPECACVQENERVVNLGIVHGGLEPYRIEYSGTRLDANNDGIADDFDGIYTYDAQHGHNITDFQEDLGELRVVYTQPVWSFTVVDARGCEIFRSGSCDNEDLTIKPTVTCPASNNTLTTEEYVCESQYTWTHPTPTDNCAVKLFDFRIANPDGTIEGPYNLNALLYPPPVGNFPVPPSFYTGTYDFELGVSTVTYYAEDAQGNFGTCSFQITVRDDDPPHFLNCPAPPVIQNAESGHCDAYVDFALPLASDNCSLPTITKIDNTGLNTGSRFPVGTTIMYWEAKDPAGNKDTCQIKVIVNDYWQNPLLTCPANVVKNNDPWLCGAVVNNIAPVVDGPCKNNYGITYTIYGDAALTQVKDCGVNNASGEFFDLGDSWVKYTVQNQPLLLITEVGQSGAVDRLEISNLGPADIDISCLEIKRVSNTVAANQTIGPVSQLPSLAPSILPVGGTRVFNFSFNAAANLPACYTISYMGTVFDQVATNGFAGCAGFTGTLNGGDVIRKCEADTDKSSDWVLAENCYPLTFGSINPDLEVMPANGTRTSLQSIEPNVVSCTFKVTTKDTEKPFCGKLTTTTTYTGPGIPNISPSTCNRSTITIAASNCIIGDIVFNRTGTATPANSTMTLISPKGIKVVITELPDDSLATLFAQKAEGTWILDVVPNPGQTVTVTGWSLTINCIAPFDLPDQVLPNLVGQCGATFTWIHPYFIDNCFNGTISVKYTTNDAGCTPPNGVLLGKGGYATTQFFCVGTTKVTYTLTDAAGNTSVCEFLVIVNDVEKPKLACPPTIFVNLSGGECGAFVNYAPASATDNCAVIDTIMTPPSGSWFTIGDHQVTIVIHDKAGNSATCTFTVSVIEYVPTDNNLICNDLSHVSMDASCVFVVTADEVLEGDNYHCYDDYIITIKNAANQPVGNSFGPADIGKTFTIKVLDPETGNSCWSNLKIEDKLKPDLTCPPAITIACSESTQPAHTGDVIAKDCSTYTTTIDDQFVDFGECGNPRAQILRTWIVTDHWGNQATCSQIIKITPFNLQDVVFPADVVVDCESTYLNPQAAQPDHTGRPSINGAPIGTGGYCSASIGFTDVHLDICAGSYEIYRTWLIANTCLPPGPNNPISKVQRIRVKDFNGPAFACPPGVTVSTDPFTCCSTAALPDMVVSEGCSHIINLEAKVTGTDPNNGNIITFTQPGHLEDFPGNNWWNPDTLAVFDYTQCLPLGTYTVRYSASDECGNVSSCNFQLTVADLIPPVASCDQTTTVAINGDDPFDCYTSADGCEFAGVTWVKATTFNDGSKDNCHPMKFSIRRMAPYSGCINGLSHDKCYPGDKSEFDLATAEADSIKFYCCEVGTTQTVILAVYQVDVNGNIMTGLDGEPIKNECMVQVEVQDKLKPACQPPANVSVNCENFDPSLWSYGKAQVADNCCLDTSKVYLGQCGLQHSVNYSLFDTVCNKGTITRTFRVFDCHGLSSQCTQRVVVSYEQDYFVKFPNDVIVTTCDGTGKYGEPVFYGEDCELLGVSFTDEIFTVVPDACFKIERTWQIINWCTFNPNLPFNEVPNPNPNPIVNATANLAGPTVSACGTIAPWAPTNVKINPTDPSPTNYCTFYDKNANGYRYKQIIKIIDGQAPAGTYAVPTCDNQNWNTANDAELWNEQEWWNNSLQTHDLCEEPTDLCIIATDSCSGSNVNVEYLLFLDLDGDGTMETVVNSVNTGLSGLGWNNVLYNNLNTPNYSGGTPRAFDERAVPSNQKYGFAIQETVVGTSKTACVRFNTQQNQSNYVPVQLPHGTHKIKWLISDGCGNNKEYEETFTVKDCKAPTVVCLNGLSVNIMPAGMITMWASDFLQYTEDNCTPAGQIKIGIRKCGAGTGFPLNPDGTPQLSVNFDCNEQGTQCVELWAMDAAGNADRCETYVIIQDNNANCPNDPNILNVSGALKTEMSDGVEEATVHINGTGPLGSAFSYFDLTDANGLYEVKNSLPLNASFTIAPEKDDNPLNGVTTYDLVLISKHILGIEPLNSPYKMIAADANKSGSITTFDIVELRKLILGIYNELPANTSWRFVDKSFAFPNVNNPFQSTFPETVTIANASSNMANGDFASIKVGDVNNSAVANATMPASERSAGVAIFDLEDRDVSAGEVFEVNFKATLPLKGFQFTVMLKGLHAMGVEEAENVTANNFNLLPENAMTVSINGAQEFKVKFKATQSGRLSEMLAVSGAITRAEAYGECGVGNADCGVVRLTPALRFDGKKVSGLGFELYQNQPNPFVNKTIIGFFLPESADATLSVFDESGRMVYLQKGWFAKGENSISLDRALLNTTGMLYYKLETASDSATRKMIQSK